MGETINLDQDHREVVRGAAKDSIVTCIKTSAPDVYVAAIGVKETDELHQGDSTAFPKISRLKFHLFRTKVGDDPFSATIDITPIPDAPKKSTEMMAKADLRQKPSKGKKKSAKKRAQR
jgi:hypothetical protein